MLDGTVGRAPASFGLLDDVADQGHHVPRATQRATAVGSIETIVSQRQPDRRFDVAAAGAIPYGFQNPLTLAAPVGSRKRLSSCLVFADCRGVETAVFDQFGVV